MPMPRRSILIIAAAVLALAAALGSYAIVSRTRGPIVTGEALIGGPFSLIDQNGARVTEKSFLGKYMLVFFGYTFCPDVCPTELQVMSAALDMMGAEAERIQPIFISVDPERDTPEVMKAYVSNFGPRMVGLTGSPDEIAAAARAYRVYYSKSGGTGPSDYLMDHSSIIYLMGPDGKFVKHFTYTTDAKALASELKEALTASP